jgi:hypothetical protein
LTHSQKKLGTDIGSVLISKPKKNGRAIALLLRKMPGDSRSRCLGALACCLIGVLVPISSKASSCELRLAESTLSQLVPGLAICSERSANFEALPLEVNHIGDIESRSEKGIEFGSLAIAEIQNVSSWSSPIPYATAEADTSQPDTATQPVENYGLRSLIVAVALIGAIRKYLVSPAYRKFWEQVCDPLNY